MNSEVVRTLGHLVAMPTISDRPVTELSSFVAERCEDLGFTIERFPDPADPTKEELVCRAGPPEEDGLILSGHMDVVPTVGQPWSSDPFTLSERGGQLYGRGTADMKGFLAATLEALKDIDTTRLRRQLVLVWTSDEELGCLGSSRLADALEGSTHRLPTQALIGEPTDFRIFRMHPGHVSMRVVAHGAAAHSSKPDLGANAISAMARAVIEVERLAVDLASERRLEDLLERPFTVLNPGVVQGGCAVNLVPDHCVLIVGYRPLPGDDPTDVATRLDRRLSSIELPQGTRLAVEIDRVSPGLLTPAGTSLEHLLRPRASSPEPIAAPFATDGGNLERLGIQSLVFGPGSIDVAHRADECIAIEALHRARTTVREIVAARCVSD